MAIRNIVKEGDPILTKVCRKVEKFDKRLKTLIDDMIETMHKSSGVGLAAPQVGILKNIVVVDIGDGPIEAINPIIVEQSGEQQEVEGCLSCPGQYGVTLRPMHIKVKAQHKNGEEFFIKADGFKARAFCHEIDHLNGILFKKRAIRMLDSSELE